MMLAKPRGTFSAALFENLLNWPDAGPALEGEPEHAEDAAIALWVLHELSYLGFENVDDRLEWEPRMLAVRHRLECDFEGELRARYRSQPRSVDTLAEDLFDLIAGHEGHSIAPYVQRSASAEQVLDLLRIRSIYHLKEADPVTWAIPKLPVRPKAALVELQFDEYGAGDPNRLHAHLFAKGMAAAGLNPEYGAYIDEATTEVLQQNNAMTLFGMHRRLNAAAVGHLAAFEATSSLPSRRMAQGLARVGLARELVEYYDEHVEADAVHEQQAVRGICVALVEHDPRLADEVFFGASTYLDTEDRLAAALLSQWGAA